MSEFFKVLLWFSAIYCGTMAVLEFVAEYQNDVQVQRNLVDEHIGEHLAFSKVQEN